MKNLGKKIVMNRKKIWKRILFLSFTWLIFCLLVYLLDLRWGNGDGLVSELNFSPLVGLLIGQLALLASFMITCQKGWLSNTGLVLLTLIFILVLIEVALQLFVPYRGGHRIENLGSRPIFSRQDPVFFKNYLPNGRFITHVDGSDGKFSVLNEINSDGIRGPEIGEKENHEKRILLLGDSYLQSDEIEFDETIGQVLEGLLSDTFRVVQHGSPSWSPLLELNWLLKKGLPLKPDYVILFLVYNDFYKGSQGSDIGYKPYCLFDSSGYPIAFHFDEPKTMRLWNHIKGGFSQLKFVKLIRSRLDKGFASRFKLTNYESLLMMPAKEYEVADDHYGFMATMRDTAIWDDDTKDRVELSMHYLELMKNVLDREDIGFGLGLVPNALQFANENSQLRDYMGFDDFVLPESGLQQRIRRFCHTRDVSFIPLYEAFKDYKVNANEFLYFTSDGHWNVTGHRVVAENIYVSLFKK